MCRTEYDSRSSLAMQFLIAGQLEISRYRNRPRDKRQNKPEHSGNPIERIKAGIPLHPLNLRNPGLLCAGGPSHFLLAESAIKARPEDGPCNVDAGLHCINESTFRQGIPGLK